MAALPTGRAICCSGQRERQSPADRSYPSLGEIRQDLRILQSHWTLLRLYDCSPHAERLLHVIRRDRLPFKVMLGAHRGAEVNNPGRPWGGSHTEAQLEASVAENEAQVHWTDCFVSVPRTIGQARRVERRDAAGDLLRERRALAAQLRALVAELDFISLHTYPAWEHKPVHEALDCTRDNHDSVARLDPHMPVIITESGGATSSNGRGIEPHNTSQGLRAIHLRELMAWSDEAMKRAS